jgi:hypothetical protein
MIEQSEHSRYLLNTVRYAAQHGRCAWTELSDCDRVAVALALDHADWLEEFGFTLAEAVEQAGMEWIAIIPQIARQLAEEETGCRAS